MHVPGATGPRGDWTLAKGATIREDANMVAVDWSQCPLVEVIPGKVSGAPLLKNTRLPVEAITGNYDAFREEGLSRDAAIAETLDCYPEADWIRLRPFSPGATLINFRRRFEGSCRRRRTRKLARSLPRHEVHTVVSMQWGGIKNGALLKLIERERFDVFLTGDWSVSQRVSFASLPERL
jgi:uncharacterized protein (DUF433 family)